ncbi:MAG: DUF4214 domain-containing protein [Bacteroidales bacterium]|nr:DUF4214 domain-containing protein [Bacteroidales bacterium]
MFRLAILMGLSTATLASAHPYIVPQPVYPGVPQAGFLGFPQAGFTADVAFVRSLYFQFLQREPDPHGMRTWLNRLAQFRGDRQRLTWEFQQAAQREWNANNLNAPAPISPYAPYGSWR